MTPNRKVNRKALPALNASQLETRKDLTLPRTAVEEKIAEIWSSVLEISTLDINDNFFDLGGHSLLATRVISRIRDQFHIDLPLRVFFKTPTIAGIADAVDTFLWASQKQSTNQKRFVGNNDEIEI
jgi:acyl carrier protein